MSYYLGKEVGYDGCGTLTDEYVVYLLDYNHTKQSSSLIFLAGFVDIESALRFLKDCYEEKISAEFINKAKVAGRQNPRFCAISNIR